MIWNKVCYNFFFFITLELVSKIHPSLHGHNNAFVQANNEVQYLLDNIPISMHKGFSSSVEEHRNSMSDDNTVDAISYIQFKPSILDFKERQLGVPHQETVTLFNRDCNKTIHVSSISGNTQHFHSSFFQDKVIPPLGNTTFNVVFLGREEGEIDSYLFIHTSDGTLKYQVRGISVSSPYRLRPVVGIKLPLNASFTPLIYMHNPHPEPMQVVEVYSSGGEFQLELPSGQAEGPRELWEIPPYQTKPVIRLHFNAYTEKNHTAYIRFKVNNSAAVLVVAVEVEVGNGAGLHWGGSSGVFNLGMGGSLQPPTHHPIALKNSAKKPVKVLNIISTPVSKALRINFEPVVVPGDTEVPVTVGTLIYDWKVGLDLQHFKGKLVVKGIGPGGLPQKLTIPWMAEVLIGGLEVNTSVTHYCAPYSTHPRNFTVVNKYKIPLAITNVSLSPEAKTLFSIKDFIPKVLRPRQKTSIFSLQLSNEKKSDNLKLESSILIHSNVSITEVPLLSYDGKVKKIIPGEKENDKGTMNFGTVGSGTENEAIFALENHNPINVELHGWGVNMPGAVLELMGCQKGPTHLFNKGVRNISVCSQIGNQSIKPGYLAVFKIKVKTAAVEEDTIVGEVFVRTTYERLTVPVFMRVAHGRIFVKKLTFTDCFPGSVCIHQVKVHSTFARPMEVTSVEPFHKDDRLKYVPQDEAPLPVISKGDNHIGSITFDSSIACKHHCYLGLSLNASAGAQWLNTLSLPSHTRDSDLNLLNTRYTRYLNSTGGGSWENITMRLDTTEVRGHRFSVNIKHYWPSLLGNIGISKNKSSLTFSLTQVGNTSYKTIKIDNPSSSPLLVQLVLDWSYPQGMRLYHSLPNKFKPICLECPMTIPSEFKLEDNSEERERFEKHWNVIAPAQSLPLYLSPRESKSIRISYTPLSASSSSALLYIRNNMTILEVLRLVGRGAHAQFKFGNRKPGSNTPLLFELADKHLKDCERERLRQSPIPNLTVKRSFTARNTGELPIDIHGFYISGLYCEGYGFKVLNCAAFKLNPNATKKIEIAFTPDFTLSRIERELLILTSLGTDSVQVEGVNESGLARLSLLTTVPAHTLEACAAVITRPSWEQPVQLAAICLSTILLICILAISFLEADRILRGALVNLSKGGPIQPPLDLRLLANVSIASTQSNALGKEKVTSDERNRQSKKDDVSPDWSIMNVKKTKEKDTQRGIKIPDWTPDEERRFKIDTESKEISAAKKLEDPSVIENANSNSNNTAPLGTKKKNNKKQNNNLETVLVETLAPLLTPIPDSQIIPEKKNSVGGLLKSSPTTTKKGKLAPNTNTVTHATVKEEVKTVENEVQAENTMQTSINIRESKSELKKKQEINSSGRHVQANNHYKKYEASNSQKVNQFSEEETSSTTTESSVHEDAVPYKDCDRTYVKPEKLQRKPLVKKGKPQTIPAGPSIDYRDNYEGDCDDDDYDKEKQDNPNRWKTSTTRSNTKHHHHPARCNTESSFKLTRPSKNTPRKEKATQKRRGTDKTHPKSNSLRATLSQRDESRPVPPAIPSPLPPPPSCWGENRAKFSDVVARNQDSISIFANANSMTKIYSKSLEIPTPCNPQTKIANNNPTQIEEEPCSPVELKINPKFGAADRSCKGDKSPDQELLSMQPNSCHSNSFFMNTFTEPPFEPELVPYELPETDEPLVELESLEAGSSCGLWDDGGAITNSKPGEKTSNLSDALKDNWVMVETNWEPLYTRGAVGEERSGVWGVNTGGVWAAAPWGAPTPPANTLQPSTTLQEIKQNIPDRSGFDPFRSLSTIWTPSSTDPWKSNLQK
ncbi:transmembrane protein 131 isoform X1 [Neodiprion virginianus]|uniref:transmembrane protein 131 isoform X1 n=1 Tax=Neodiprion virginianus TaxID=2961670 RepID=UPI001EE77461|nr:transmembrane protein 131 isoform X1 [Neodiprion virginianus]